MNLLARFDPGDASTGLVFIILLQTSVVIVLAAFWSGTWLRRRAEGRHALWLGVLGVLVVSPAMAAAVRQSGFTLWTIALPVTDDGARPALEDHEAGHLGSRGSRRCSWWNRPPRPFQPRMKGLRNAWLQLPLSRHRQSLRVRRPLNYRAAGAPSRAV